MHNTVNRRQHINPLKLFFNGDDLQQQFLVLGCCITYLGHHFLFELAFRLQDLKLGIADRVANPGQL